MTSNLKDPAMSAEEAIADILVTGDCLTASEAPDFIEELAKRGYIILPATMWYRRQDDKPSDVG